MPKQQLKVNIETLDRALNEITRTDHRIRHAENLRQLIINGIDNDLYRINIRTLASSWGTDVKVLVPLFLWSVKTGIMDMHWDIHCPQCNGRAEHHHELHHLKSESYCPRCKMDFSCTIDSTVEVSFSVNANIRKIAVNDNPGMNNAAADARLTGFEVINSPVFRKFFSRELLSENESLSVRHVAIMFTDLKGSTKMYLDLGDARAFKIVKQHFDVLEEEINSHQGVIVKTIGDAIMASFGKTGDAIGAAIAVQKRFREFNDQLHLQNGVTLRIGIHVGPSLVVTLNNRLDYFGTMVNVAARVEGLGDGKEIIITKDVFDDLGVRHELLKQAKNVEFFSTQLKGVEEEQKLVKIIY